MPPNQTGFIPPHPTPPSTSAVRTVPALQGLSHDVLTLWWYESDTHSVETVLRSVIFPRASDPWYNSIARWAAAADDLPRCGLTWVFWAHLRQAKLGYDVQ